MNRCALRSAFTLVELVVVIGLMGLLATISIAGYGAATRGMAARAAKDDTIAFIRLAQQRCRIDNVPTAVVFFNRKLALAGSTGADGQLTEEVVVGTAVAIRMGGRITGKADKASGWSSATGGKLLLDEFADWDQSYPKSGQASASAGFMRLFNMQKISTASTLDNCSSEMNVSVDPAAFEEYMIATNEKVDDWCQNNGLNQQGIQARTGGSSSLSSRNANNWRWGLGFYSRNQGLNEAGWKVGDAYGFEIGTFQLPKGYIFGNSTGSGSQDVTSSGVRPLWFEPKLSDNSYEFSSITPVTITATGDMKSPEIRIQADDLRDAD